MQGTDIKLIQRSIQEIAAQASGARANGQEIFHFPLVAANFAEEDTREHFQSGVLAELRAQGYDVSEWNGAGEPGIFSIMVVFTPKAKRQAQQAGYVFPTPAPAAPASPQEDSNQSTETPSDGGAAASAAIAGF